MAKELKPKRKYPETREFQSKTANESNISSERYTTDVKTVYTIKGSLNDEVHNDIAHAIDDVLKFHGF